jgi:hypothetical protein
MTEILYFKVQLNGHIKVIESMEKKLKIKNLETLILIEKNNSESLVSNTVTAPRILKMVIYMSYLQAKFFANSQVLMKL